MKNNNTLIPFERQEIIRRERHLAKYANTMDCLFCIPFTKQGVGLDAILSLIPFIGDIAGLLLTLKAFRMGKELGVPEHKMRPPVLKRNRKNLPFGAILLLHGFICTCLISLV